MLVSEAVATVRSMLTGSQMDEVSVLAVPFNPATDSTLTLRYPKRNVGVGHVISAGLNTFQVISVSGDGTTLDVLPAMDGGPNAAVPEGEIVRFRPAFTTWAIVRELQSEIDGMSSPEVGLYWPWVYVPDEINRVSGIYPLPTEEDVALPFRVVRADYQISGTEISQQFTEYEYQPNTNSVRVFQDPPRAIGYTFTLALPYGQILTLDQDMTSIGLTPSLSDVAILGCAASMILGWEGRRTQMHTQADPRRPGEVSVGSNAALARQWRQRQQAAINQELSRLTRLYGYRQPNTTGQTTGGSFSTWRGFR